MRIELPRYTERLGAVRLHDSQRVYELDSGTEKCRARLVRKIEREEMEEVEGRLAIVIPVKGDRVKILEGVLSGIPHDCLTIIVSNSPRQPADMFCLEADMLRQFNHFTERDIIAVHQKDPGLAGAFRTVGYTSILDGEGLVRDGKAEGMLTGIMLAKLAEKDYVGFVDADNYVPGAVHEYVQDFAAGFLMANTPYTIVRLSWIYKPKVSENGLYFSKWGRVSEVSNKYLNSLISSYMGFDTEVVKTGNSGEHAMTMRLAELLTYSSGFSMEPYELINIFEEFGGVRTPRYQKVMDEGVEIFQIVTINPHFHEDRGNDHIKDVLTASLAPLYHCKLCPTKLKNRILGELAEQGALGAGEEPLQLPIMHPLKGINSKSFGKVLRENASTLTDLRD